MNKPMHILSLGVGVQSSTLALMADKGIISPKPKACGFADTQGEPKLVYEWLKTIKGLLKIPVFEVSRGSLAVDSLKIMVSKKSGKRYMKGLIPAFLKNDDGSKGLMGRKCTRDYKIAMIVRECRRMLGKETLAEWRKKHRTALQRLAAWERAMRAFKKAKKEKKPLPQVPDYPLSASQECKADALVVMWIGISTDEADRMKESKEPWIQTRWPLIEMEMSREDCLAWMKDNGYPEPPRSACTYCPFHSDEEWKRIKTESPAEFQAVVEYEAALQKAAREQETLKGIPFLHASLLPIGQVEFKTGPGHAQLRLFSNECEGLCGV